MHNVYTRIWISIYQHTMNKIRRGESSLQKHDYQYCDEERAGVWHSYISTRFILMPKSNQLAWNQRWHYAIWTILNGHMHHTLSPSHPNYIYIYMHMYIYASITYTKMSARHNACRRARTMQRWGNTRRPRILDDITGQQSMGFYKHTLYTTCVYIISEYIYISSSIASSQPEKCYTAFYLSLFI